MQLDTSALIDAVASHAAQLGYFDAVNQHEPKSAPRNGLTAAVWVQHLGPVPTNSGLAATSARLELRVRLYQSMLQEPQDMIDPNLVAAADALLAAYSGDFTLDGRVHKVDLLGSAGEPLQARAGYLRMESGRMYRVLDVTLPLLVNDVWEQVP